MVLYLWHNISEIHISPVALPLLLGVAMLLLNVLGNPFWLETAGFPGIVIIILSFFVGGKNTDFESIKFAVFGALVGIISYIVFVLLLGGYFFDYAPLALSIIIPIVMIITIVFDLNKKIFFQKMLYVVSSILFIWAILFLVLGFLLIPPLSQGL